MQKTEKSQCNSHRSLQTLLYFGCVWAFLLFGGTLAHAQKSDFVPGEIIVHFQNDIVDFPVGGGRRPIEQVRILNPQARALLRDIAASELERVFRSAVPHDTLKTDRLGRIKRVADASQIYKLKISGDVLAAVEKLKALPFVNFAEPNYVASLDTELPNDFHFVEDRQWGLHNTGQFGYTADVDVDAPEAWEITTGSSNVLVGVVDSGIDYNHPDLGADFGVYPNQKIVEGWNYIADNNDPLDDSRVSHGTAVAGIIGALTNNDDGSEDHQVAGIGGGWANSPFGFKLLPVKVLNEEGSGSIDDIANGILWAAQTGGADVLNLSLSGSSESNTQRFAVTEAFNLGTITVASMGNNNSSSPEWPAAYDHSLISVGAIDWHGSRVVPDDEINWGSNTGAWLDVMAPGRWHFTTARLDSGGYDGFRGTSAAAPFVSGFAGLILSVDPTASFEKVEAIIRASGTTYPSWNNEEGYGYIKMRKGLDLLLDPGAQEYNWTASGGTGSFDNATFSFGTYTYQRFKVEKTVFYTQNFIGTPVVWGERSGSTGVIPWPANTAQLTYNYTGVKPGSEFNDGATLVTFVYKKLNLLGQFVGWVPTAPENVQFAYAVLGIPAPPPPPAPQNLAITNAGNLGENVQLSWDASTGADSYNVYRCMTNWMQGCEWGFIGSTTTTSYTDFAVVIRSAGQSDDTFHYYVKAENGCFFLSLFLCALCVSV